MFKLITKFSKHNTYQKKVQMQRPRLLFGRESKDWIWSNEVKNLTWLVNSSIMYEPPQIVCMAPFFCTRKAIQKHCYLPGMKTRVLKWSLLQYNLMVKVHFLTIRFSRFIILPTTIKMENIEKSNDNVKP